MVHVLRTAEAVIEPVPVQDVYADGIEKIELLGGGCARITLFAYRMEKGAPTKVIVARIIGQVSSVPTTIARLQALAAQAKRAIRKVPKLFQ